MIAVGVDRRKEASAELNLMAAINLERTEHSPASIGGMRTEKQDLLNTPMQPIEVGIPAGAAADQPSPPTQHKPPQYYCQRCANHKEYYPRKGHKPACLYARCSCSLCIMVEQRRQLNGGLNPRKLGLSNGLTAAGGKSAAAKGPKKREPKCAMCAAHGKVCLLRGHKKKGCPFDQPFYTEAPYSTANPHTHPCDRCPIVKQRRGVMAQQIKARRHQKRDREKLEGSKLDQGSPRSSIPDEPEPAGLNACLSATQESLFRRKSEGVIVKTDGSASFPAIPSSRPPPLNMLPSLHTLTTLPTLLQTPIGPVGMAAWPPAVPNVVDKSSSFLSISSILNQVTPPSAPVSSAITPPNPFLSSGKPVYVWPSKWAPPTPESPKSLPISPSELPHPTPLHVSEFISRLAMNGNLAGRHIYSALASGQSPPASLANVLSILAFFSPTGCGVGTGVGGGLSL